jgi:hypothetical protein
MAPEINQISIKESIGDECTGILRDAVMHLAFIRIFGNKLSEEYSTRDNMYAIHPIYAPYFVFSFRKKRKMEISEEEFMGIISEPKKHIELILKKKKISIDDIRVLPAQLELFKDFYNND